VWELLPGLASDGGGSPFLLMGFGLGYYKQSRFGSWGPLGERFAMRKLFWASTVAAVLLAVSALTSAAAPASSGSRGAHRFWYAIASGESFAGAVRHAAGEPGSQVTATVKDMIVRVETGKRVMVPEGTRNGVHLVPATLTELQAALAAARSAGARSGTSVARLVRIPDPHDFPIRGQGCNPVTWRGNRYWASWCKMPFKLVGGVCDPSCHNTDVLTARLLVDPGTSTSRASRSGSYTYQSGNPRFSNIHFEWWTFCFNSEQECGTGNTPNFFGNSSGTFNMTSSKDLHNSRIRHAFVFWAYFVPNNQWTPDEAKTWKGICKPRDANSNQCLYPA